MASILDIPNRPPIRRDIDLLLLLGIRLKGDTLRLVYA